MTANDEAVQCGKVVNEYRIMRINEYGKITGNRFGRVELNSVVIYSPYWGWNET